MIINVCDSNKPDIKLSTLSSDYGVTFLHLMYKCIYTCALRLMDKSEGEPWKHPYGLIKGQPWGMYFNDRIRVVVWSFQGRDIHPIDIADLKGLMHSFMQ